MKAKLFLSFLTVALGLSLAGASPNAPAPPLLSSTSAVISPYSVTERGPHYRLWQQVISQTNLAGETFYKTNSYTELATGLCYWNGTQWADASDQIQLSPNGAAATNTQHQVAFAANINTSGAISLTTPDGQQMTSQILGLAYFDSDANTNVLFAEIQDSIGQLLPSGNQVIYTNAFTNADCDVLYSQKLSGFEQDIVIRQQLPSPNSFGLNGSNIWLQIWTEFPASPAPAVSENTNNGDSFLDFGAMKMGPGKAFMLGNTSNAVPVIKEWLNTQGRTFLVESVPLRMIAAPLSQLPGGSGTNSGSGASSGSPGSINSPHVSFAALKPPHANLKGLKLPVPNLAKTAKGSMHLAAGQQSRKGLVLDYNLSGSQTNFTFQSDTTYYVTNEVDLYGTNIIEGGTVIKFASYSGQIVLNNSNIVCLTGPYRPAILTAMDDNSIGTEISGSTGSPTNQYGSGLGALWFNYPQSAPGSNFFHFRFSFLSCAVGLPSSVGYYNFYDSQFVNCQSCFSQTGENAILRLYNCLFWNCEDVSTYGIWVNNPQMYCENVTMHQCTEVAAAPDGYSLGGGDLGDCIFKFTNSLVVTSDTSTMGAYLSTNNTAILSSDTGVFQTVAAGNHYLATNTPYTNGTTNINLTLLADLAQKTVWPPLVLSNQVVSNNTVLTIYASRDTNTSLYLGYHYDPLDYIVDDYAVTNATLTVTNAAIACFDDPNGIGLQDNSSLVSIGTPLSPNWFTVYQMVQEQSVIIGSNGPSPCYVIPYTPNTVQANATFQFTEFSGGSTQMLYNGDGYSYNSLLIQDCEFWAGGWNFYGSTNTSESAVIDNNLFVRCAPVCEMVSGSSFAFSNNLVWCATFPFYSASSNTFCAFNNIFDTCDLQLGHVPAVSNGYNAYLNCTNRLQPTNAFDIVTNTSLAYQSGPLGDFYQPADSPLLYMGSTNASLVGLYEYTTQTNETKDGTNMVSIGYHYVATSNGVPDSTLWLGIPDYLVDTNGSGATNLSAWQLEYFGYTGLNPNSDPYNQGVTLLQDYDSGNNMAPVIANLSISNNYVSTVTTPVLVSVPQGIPYYMAVLVDNTNFASATWTNYNSNAMVNLGTNQGWHNVWIGVSALPTNAPPLWQQTHFDLETTPPQIVITGPSNTISQTLVQLTGYSPELLSQISCNLSNSVGIQTNIQILRLDRLFYDTNNCVFTTNTFQAFDVWLTNGINTFSVFATDMAGNMASTNYSITVETDTNAPVIALTWPDDGMNISTTNFTIIGTLDDVSATITATVFYTDTNGCTNASIYSAIIERNGTFWFENLPLYAGTNSVSLSATDPWGNVSTTNFAVNQSSFGLTINSVDTSLFYLPYTNVSGTISDPTYSVWVNGVPGTNNGDGTWSATNVPITPGGTASFYVSAYPSGDTYTTNPQPDLNPIDPNSQNTMEEEDKPYRVWVENYTETDNSIQTITDTYLLGGSFTLNVPKSNKSINWKDDTGGGEQQESLEISTSTWLPGPVTNIDCDYTRTWPSSFWPDLPIGSFSDSPMGCSDDVAGPPNIVMQYINDSYQTSWNFLGWDPTNGFYNEAGMSWPVGVPVSASAKINFQTGGKAAITANRLWQLSSSATEITYIGITSQYNAPVPTNIPVPCENIVMGELPNLGSDCNLFIALPNNTQYDITPTVYVLNHYTFTFPSVTPHELTLSANSIDLSTNQPEFCVGQQALLNRSWNPVLPTGCTSTNRWTITGDYINSIVPTTAGASPLYLVDSSLLATNPTSLWWNGTAGEQIIYYKETVFFTNGNQPVSFNESATVVVYRPAIVKFIDEPPAYPTNAVDVGDLYISLGDNNNHGDMDYEVYLFSKYSGRTDYTQLVNRSATSGGTPYGTGGAFELDNYIFYLNKSNDPNSPYQVISNKLNKRLIFTDNPGIQLTGSSASVTDQFIDYVMFRPDAGNASSNIYVTLGKGLSSVSGESWGWSGSTIYSSGAWSPATGSVTRVSSFDDSDDFPEWPATISNTGP